MQTKTGPWTFAANDVVKQARQRDAYLRYEVQRRQRSGDESEKKPQLSQDHPQVVAAAAQQHIERVAIGALEPITSQPDQAFLVRGGDRHLHAEFVKLPRLALGWRDQRRAGSQKARRRRDHPGLLDNFSTDLMREAFVINAGRALLKASGGINFDTVRAIAETGVDRISIGSLTKDIRATDYSLRIVG